MSLLLLVACGSREGRGPASAGTGAGIPRPGEGAAPPRSFLLVTIDTWRADHLEPSGATSVTPRLAKLASEGAAIPRVWSPAPLTAPTHASILTGLVPRSHGVRDNLHFRLSPGVSSVAEDFRQSGRRTAAFVSASPLRRAVGLDRGFDRYDDAGFARPREGALHPPERRGDRTVDAASAWLDGLPTAAPFFLWVHLYDPHAPYDAPGPGGAASPREAYRREVAFADEQVGRLVERARRQSGDSIAVLVTSDHGEGLGDHGEETHGIGLYDSTLRVPAILWSPSGVPAIAAGGARALVDVAPTLRAWAGLPARPSDGRSWFASSPQEARWLDAEAIVPMTLLGVAPARALLRESEVALFAGTEEAWDVGADPRQEREMAGKEREAFLSEARREAGRLRAQAPDEAIFGSAVEPSSEEVSALRSLGYLGRRPAVGKGGALPAVSMSRMIRGMSRLEAARAFAAAERWADAEKAFGEFLAEFPASSVAFQERGVARLRLRRFDAARGDFLEALERDPGDGVSLLNLGNLEMMAGRRREGLALWERSITVDPDQPETLYNLGAGWLEAGDAAKATKYFGRFLEVSPDDPEAARVRAALEELRRGAGGAASPRREAR